MLDPTQNDPDIAEEDKPVGWFGRLWNGIKSSALVQKAQALNSRFQGFKQRHSTFAKIWNFFTHPTTVRIIGLALSVALAPLTGGFTTPFIIAFSVSVALTFSSPVIIGIQKYLLAKAQLRERLLKLVPPQQNQAVLKAVSPTSPILRKARSFVQKIMPGIANEYLAIQGAATAVTAVVFGIGSAIGFAGSLLVNATSIISEAATRIKLASNLVNTKNANNKRCADLNVAPNTSITNLRKLVQESELSQTQKQELASIDEALKDLDPFAHIASALNPLLATHEAPPPRTLRKSTPTPSKPSSLHSPTTALHPNSTPNIPSPNSKNHKSSSAKSSINSST